MHWVNDPWLERALANYREPVTDFDIFRAQPHQVQWELAFAAALTPNAGAPELYLDRPFAIENGEAQIAPNFPSALAAASPMADAERYAAQPERLNGILLYPGVADYSAPLDLARTFSA